VKLWVHVVEARIHWGFSVRSFPGSAAQQSHIIPPPTTILGAVAYGLTSAGLIRGEVYERDGSVYSSAARVVEEFWPVYATAGFKDIPVAPPRSLQMIKYLSAFYRAWADVEEKARSLALPELRSPIGIGYTAAPASVIRIALVAGKRIPSGALWSIVRLGSRESLVSVLDVAAAEAEPSEPTKEVSTGFAFPAHVVAPGGILGVGFVREVIPFPVTIDEWLWIYSVTAKLGGPPLREVIVPIGEPVRVDGSKLSALVVPAGADRIIVPRGLLQ